MARHGKKYRAAEEKIDPDRRYSAQEGVKLLKEVAFAQFDESVELHIHTGLDPKHADQIVRGSASLPAGTGRNQRVVAFAEGDKAREAEAAGADFVGLDDLLARIQGGWLDFDVAIAVPSAMGKVGRVARILGPRGLMPNPRSGTVTDDVAKSIQEIKAGRVEFRVDRTGVIHAPVGKVSFTEENILRNVGSLVDAVVRAKPSGSKGVYIQSLALASTMGPGIHLEVAPTLALASTSS